MPSLRRRPACPGARPCPGRSSLDTACAPRAGVLTAVEGVAQVEEAVDRQHGPSGQEVHDRTQPDKGYGERRGLPQNGRAAGAWLPDGRQSASSL